MSILPTSSSSRTQLRWVVISIVIAFGVMVLYFGVFNYYATIREAENGTLMRLSGIANTLALQLDGDDHEALMARYPEMDDPEAINDSLYQQIHTMLKDNFQSNMLKTPVYTIVLDSQKNCYFAVTSAEQPYFRHKYASAPAEFIETHPEGGTLGPYEDEFGMWLSGFAAVRNSQEQIVAIVQVDQRFDLFQQQTRYVLLRNIGLGIVFILILLWILLLIIQPLIRKEHKNREALSAAYEENLTIKKKLEWNVSTLESFNQFRKEMIANLSHDLRTPLSNVMGYVETTYNKYDELNDEERREFLSIAYSEGKRLNALIGQLTDLSKLESNSIQLQLEPFNLMELLQDMLPKYQRICMDKELVWLIDIPQNISPIVIADVAWIDRVLQNLMDNAVKYAGQNGKIRLRLVEHDAQLEISICNSGNPIKKEDQASIFERYFKVAKNSNEGSGLGLSIVKKIVELHGEKIALKVTDDINTFYFSLPLYK